jgi:hypothetical protein
MELQQSYTVNIESAPLAEKITLDTLEAFASTLFEDRRIAGPAPSANLAINTLGLTTSIDAPSPDYAFKTSELSFLEAAKGAGLGKPTLVVVDVELDRVDQVDRHELVSGGDVARRLKISRERVRQLSENPARFPAPLAILGRDRVWRWVDIVDWAAARKRYLAPARGMKDSARGRTVRKAAKKMAARK